MSPGVYFILYHTEFHGSRIIEFANYHLSHGISRVTNYRIIEFLFTRSSTENHGFIYLVMNSLIRKFGIKKKIRDIP